MCNIDKLKAIFTNTGNKIRAKKGCDYKIKPESICDELDDMFCPNCIPEATARAEDIQKGKTAYINGGLATGTHEDSIILETPKNDGDNLAEITFNTSLTAPEVTAILDRLNISNYNYLINWQDSDTIVELGITKNSSGYIISYYDNSVIIFDSSLDNCWLVDKLEIDNPLNMYNAIMLDQLTELVNIKTGLRLKGDYDTTTYETEEQEINIADLISQGKLPLKIKFITKSGGTAVPNTGYIEKVYFNTELSVQEVVEVLSQLTLNVEGTNEMLLGCMSPLVSITIASMDGMYIIGDFANMNFYFSSAIVEELGITFEGWNSDFNGTIAVNGEVMSEEPDSSGNIPIGTQNELIKDLFSLTPFN